MNKPKLAVGMTVWVVYAWGRRSGVERTIIKVGKKWAYTDSTNERFDINTWLIDGGDYAPKGSVYASEQAWLDYKILSDKWQKFRLDFQQDFRSEVPEDMTFEKIQQIKEILGMPE